MKRLRLTTAIERERFVHIDVETRSYVDLIKQGAYVYANPNLTDILVVRYSFGASEEIPEWWPWLEKMPKDLRKAFKNPDLLLAAHNAQFERLIFNRVGVPKYDVPPTAIERWYCTLYQMSINNLPESLHNAGKALKTNLQKDARGKSLIRQLSNPREDGTFNEDPDLLREFSAYCGQDVRTERALCDVTRLATEAELQDYWACEYINDRGVRIHAPLAAKAVDLAGQVADNAETEIERLTNDEVHKPRGPTLTTWLYERLPKTGQNRMIKMVKNKDTDQFEPKVTLDKNARERLLDWPDLEPHLREVVEVAESVGSGSVAKFQAMLNGLEPDGRVRGSYTCSGAPATGRYSARRLQVHNFTRDCYKDPPAVIKRFLRKGELPDMPMLALKRLLRAALIAAPKHTFVCSDWSAIEGRALPWLTLDRRCEPKLDLFREEKDVYLVTASEIYREPVKPGDPRRQVGKVAELALGYQGAAGSFKVMGANYGVYLPEVEVIKVVDNWRRANRGIVKFWSKLEENAMKAVQNPGTEFPVGRVSFLFNEEFLSGTLWMRLPSGRVLSYTHCRIEFNKKFRKFGLTSLDASSTPEAGSDEWARRNLYGGLFAENATQGVCACLLREALRALVQDELPVVLHTHDEALLEVPKKYADQALETLEDYLLFTPAWAQGLPLAVESWVGPFYRK